MQQTIHETIKNRLALRLKRLSGAYRLGNTTESEMQLQRTKEIAQAQRQIESLKRIPTNTPAKVTFFSVNDEWVFTAVMDNHVCPACLAFEFQIFTGDLLRSRFPELEIDSLETISPKVHPNCRCHLDRILYFGDIGVEK
jgi:hypothetical protein